MKQNFLLLAALCLLVVPEFVMAYESGHQALQVWDAEGQANAPLWVQYWVKFIALTTLVGLLFARRHAEARWAVGGIILGILVTRLLIPALGVVKLSGLVALVHLVFWSPALFLLLKNRPFMQGWSAYSVWAAVMTFVICFSFVFDIRDAAIYLHHLVTR